MTPFFQNSPGSVSGPDGLVYKVSSAWFTQEASHYHVRHPSYPSESKLQCPVMGISHWATVVSGGDRSTEAQELEQKYVAAGFGELGRG